MILDIVVGNRAARLMSFLHAAEFLAMGHEVVGLYPQWLQGLPCRLKLSCIRHFVKSWACCVRAPVVLCVEGRICLLNLHVEKRRWANYGSPCRSADSTHPVLLMLRGCGHDQKTATAEVAQVFG